MKIFRVSAAMQKKSDPRKNIWITVIERNGCSCHQIWPETMRVWSAHGANFPASSPKTRPLKQTTVVTKEPSQRPPR